MSARNLPIAVSLAVLVLGPITGLQAGTVLYVDVDARGANTGANWTDAFTDLQAALAAARVPENNVSEIWVAEGTYQPAPAGGDPQVSFELVDGVALYGGFAGTETALDQRDVNTRPTLLTGDLNGNDDGTRPSRADNAARLVSIRYVTLGTVFDGFTLTHAQQAIGLYRAACELRNLVVSENNANYAGAGLIGSQSTCRLVRCRFLNNVAGSPPTGGSEGGAAVWLQDVAMEAVDCTFAANVAYAGNTPAGGGAVRVYDGTISFQDCRLLGNRVLLAAPGGLASGGAILQAQGTLRMVNCVLAGNVVEASFVQLATSSTLIAGAAAVPADTVLTNCTVAFNRAGKTQGGIFGGDAGARFVNCILWGNSDAGGSTESAQISTLGAVAYSCVQGWTGAMGGLGNFGANPLFIHPAGPDSVIGTLDDDYRLAAISPCIDAGNNAALPPGVVTDLAGMPRFVDDPATPDTGAGTPPIVDLGAYEFVPGPQPLRLLAAQSVKRHGDTGEFSLELIPAAQPPVESRGGPLLIRLVFSEPVRAADDLLDTEVSASAGTVGAVSANGTIVDVPIAGVPDATCLTLTVAGIESLGGEPLAGPAAVSVRVLPGDVNGDGVVASADITQIKSRSGLAADASSFLFDVNADGVTASADITQVKARAGQTITCGP